MCRKNAFVFFVVCTVIGLDARPRNSIEWSIKNYWFRLRLFEDQFRIIWNLSQTVIRTFEKTILPFDSSSRSGPLHLASRSLNQYNVDHDKAEANWWSNLWTSAKSNINPQPNDEYDYETAMKGPSTTCQNKASPDMLHLLEHELI